MKQVWLFKQRTFYSLFLLSLFYWRWKTRKKERRQREKGREISKGKKRENDWFQWLDFIRKQIILKIASFSSLVFRHFFPYILCNTNFKDAYWPTDSLSLLFLSSFISILSFSSPFSFSLSLSLHSFHSSPILFSLRSSEVSVSCVTKNFMFEKISFLWRCWS